MKARRVQAWVWWLLPLLVARAMLPVGFMAQTHGGQFEVVFCSTSGDSKFAAAHGDSTESSRSSQSDAQAGSCPFAHAAAAPLPVYFFDAVFVDLITDGLPPDVSPPSTVGPPRLDQARGPPALS